MVEDDQKNEEELSRSSNQFTENMMQLLRDNKQKNEEELSRSSNQFTEKMMQLLRDNKQKNEEELSFFPIQFTENMMQLLRDLSNLTRKIEQAKNEEEKKKILAESDVKRILDVVEENMQIQNQIFLNKISNLKKKNYNQITIHNNIVKILNSVDIQNPKIKELIQKENELVDYYNKRIEILDQFYSQMKMIENLIPLMKAKDKLEKEIEQIAKEVDLEYILSDK